MKTHEPPTLTVGQPLPDCEDCLGDPEWEAAGTGYPCACRAEECGPGLTVIHTYRPDPERMVDALVGLLDAAPLEVSAG